MAERIPPERIYWVGGMRVSVYELVNLPLVSSIKIIFLSPKDFQKMKQPENTCTITILFCNRFETTKYEITIVFCRSHLGLVLDVMCLVKTQSQKKDQK